jgi:hypothetical protein
MGSGAEKNWIRKERVGRRKRSRERKGRRIREKEGRESA